MLWLFNPAVRIMNQLKYPAKFILIGSLTVIAVSVLVVQLLGLASANLKSARKELYGIEYITPLSKVTDAAQDYRQLTSEYLMEDKSLNNKVLTLQAQIDTLMKDLVDTDAVLNKYLNSSENLVVIKNKWNQIKAEALHVNADASFALQTDFIALLLNQTKHIADTSHLILDPKIDSCYLVDLISTELPPFIERASQILAMSLHIHHHETLAVDDQIKLKVLKNLFVDGSLPQLRENVKKIIMYNPMLKNNYESLLLQLSTQVGSVNAELENILQHNAGHSSQEQNFSKLLNAVIDNGYKMGSIARSDLENILKARVQSEKYSIYFNVAVAMISFLLLVYFFVGFYLSVRKGIAQLSLGSDKLAAGNLNFDVQLETKDELTQVASSFNTMRNTLSSFITETQSVVSAAVKGDLSQRISLENKQGFAQQMADILNQLTLICQKLITEIKTAINATNIAAKEIASGNTDLAKRTESQAAALEETAASIEELTSTVKQNADNAKQANQLSVSASKVASKGGEVVKQVVNTMSDINTSSRKVVDIISVIDGIAFQTNILALNAAVEAARAGEQGRGFAVVATEVRNLAQRSAAAAKEIKMLIVDSVDKVSNGTKLVDEAGSTMNEIVNAVQQVTEIMSAITAASLEQSTGIEQVNQAVYQMDESTQQNAALVEEAATAAQALEAQAQYMSDLVAGFKVEEADITPIPIPYQNYQKQKSTKEIITHPPKMPPTHPKRETPLPKHNGHPSEWEEF